MAKIKFITMFPYAIGLILVFAGHALGTNCQLEGVADEIWVSQYTEEIWDTHEGHIFSKRSIDIVAISSIQHVLNDLNKGPYLQAQHERDEFSISLLPNFATYEQDETASSIAIRVTFRCSNLGTKAITIRISIRDTNNHDPEFLDAGVFEYKIYTPVPANFPISLIFGEMVVRDIDLTTYEIIPTLDSTDKLKLTYNGTHSFKQFQLDLWTNSVIMGIPTPMTIGFSITDVDRTGDPPRTRRGTIILSSDPSTQFLITPEFEDPFYRGTYENNILSFEKNIILGTGFDDTVTFSLENDDSRYFRINSEGNKITIYVPSPIPNEIVQARSFMLFTLLAKKETLVGSTAIIVELPKAVYLKY